VENRDLRQALVFTVWIRSTNGLLAERSPERGSGKVQSSSAQRSSITQPRLTSGNACRNAVTAGSVWMMSPIEPKRTISKLRGVNEAAFSEEDGTGDCMLTNAAA
jgi:hypothetical protein